MHQISPLCLRSSETEHRKLIKNAEKRIEMDAGISDERLARSTSRRRRNLPNKWKITNLVFTCHNGPKTYSNESVPHQYQCETRPKNLNRTVIETQTSTKILTRRLIPKTFSDAIKKHEKSRNVTLDSIPMNIFGTLGAVNENIYLSGFRTVLHPSGTDTISRVSSGQMQSRKSQRNVRQQLPKSVNQTFMYEY